MSFATFVALTIVALGQSIHSGHAKRVLPFEKSPPSWVPVLSSSSLKSSLQHNTSGCPAAQENLQIVGHPITWDNPQCKGAGVKPNCGFVDNVQECCDACRKQTNCSAWCFFANSANTGPPAHPRTKHSCELMDDTPAQFVGSGLYISGMVKTVPSANPYPDVVPQPKVCVPPFDNATFCDPTMAPDQRAKLLTQMLTLDELISQMAGPELAPIKRLNIPSYRYGHEGLHGLELPCLKIGKWEQGGLCYTNFPTSSATVASFNRSLWFAIGSAMSDESRGMYNDGFNDGLHIRGPQLNPQRDPSG